MKSFLSDAILDLKLGLDGFLSTVDGFNFELKYKVLYFISKSERTSPKDLIDFFQMAKSNVASMCAGLQKDGLIAKRMRTGSGKEIYYMITKKGEAEVVRQKQALESVFGKEELEQCSDLAQRLGAALRGRF